MSEEKKQYYWTDIESGVTFPCSKEYYDTMKATWIAAKPKLTKDYKKFGTMIITGTGGEL